MSATPVVIGCSVYILTYMYMYMCITYIDFVTIARYIVYMYRGGEVEID